MTISNTSTMTHYQSFARSRLPEVAQDHAQASVDLSSSVTSLCLTNAVLRLTDPANDAFYAQTQHRIAHIMVIRGTLLMHGAGLALSYLDHKLKPKTVLAKGLQSPSHIKGTKWVILFDTYTEDWVRVPIDGIFKLTLETMAIS